jgi:hypothetical protein
MRVLFLITAILVVMVLFRNQSFQKMFKPPLQMLQMGGEPANEPNTVTVMSSFTSNVMVKGWRMEILVPGVVALCTFRKAGDGVFTITGETMYQATKAGKQSIDIIATNQLPVKAGDYYGIRAIGKNIIRPIPDTEARLIISNNTEPMAVGSSLSNTVEQPGTTYVVTPITTGLFMAPNDGKMGSQKHPAKSAQHILQHYKANTLGRPSDGIYWIKPEYGSTKHAVEIYCNFSLREDHGYMLVGAAAAGPSWPKFNTGKYPFSPDFSHGKYDKYGRTGTYYLKWSDFDRGALSNNDPEKCKKGGHIYNKEGKYCGLKGGARLKLKGSITEIMLTTGNNKYWVVLDRDTLVSGADGSVVPVASSMNFETRPGVECKPNNNVYIKTKTGADGEPWINMGTSYACGDNYMFWGEDDFHANEQFKNKNEGIRVFIGGSYESSTGKSGGSSRHNPSFHMAPGRKSGQSTYKEAINMCRSLGKKICTRKQLDQAQDTGFGGSSCGWTSTGPDRFSVFSKQPLSVDIWANDEAKDCKILSKDKDRSDIYCCDSYEFEGFKHLDEPYSKATLWITKLEQTFLKRFNTDVPVQAAFIVYGDNQKGVAVKKVSDSLYELISADAGGSAPSKWPIKAGKAPLCQINASSVPVRAKAKFLLDLPEFDIKKGKVWSGTDNTLVKYGSTIRFFNKGANLYLTATETPYTHLPGKNLPQVVAHNTKDKPSTWRIEPVDSQRAGTSIGNGDVIYLYNNQTQGRLAANITQSSVPGSRPGDVLLSTYDKNNNITDCQWKVQPLVGNYWNSQSSIRLQHVNTGKVVEVTGAKHNSGRGTVGTVSGSVHYDHRSAWKTQLIANNNSGTSVQKCVVYLNKIARARQLANQGGPNQANITKTTQDLVEQFDKECYDIPKSAYNKAIWRLYKEIRSQLKLLTKETGLYDSYHAKEVAVINNLKNQETLMVEKKAELKKLRSRKCIPVKKCVNETHRGPADVNEVCHSLVPLLKNGKISDELIDKIGSIKKGEISVNDYDIRTHPNAHKYVKNKDVITCV